jgi:hypothetical protein
MPIAMRCSSARGGGVIRSLTPSGNCALGSGARSLLIPGSNKITVRNKGHVASPAGSFVMGSKGR